jgi:hypothetical protein
VATVGFPDIGFNAKAQSGKDARQTLFILCALAPLRLCVDFPEIRVHPVHPWLNPLPLLHRAAQRGVLSIKRT